MEHNFDYCLKIMLKSEGGYVWHKDDPGGQTNLGVTKAVYDEFYETDADEETMRGLKESDVRPIYYENYWMRCRCDDLPTGVDLQVFDIAVNSGSGRSGKILQRVVGATIDGGIGEKTLAAVAEMEPSDIIRAMGVERELFYRDLKTFDTFGKGWLNRNKHTTDTALEMENIEVLKNEGVPV